MISFRVSMSWNDIVHTFVYLYARRNDNSGRLYRSSSASRQMRAGDVVDVVDVSPIRSQRNGCSAACRSSKNNREPFTIYDPLALSFSSFFFSPMFNSLVTKQQHELTNENYQYRSISRFVDVILIQLALNFPILVDNQILLLNTNELNHLVRRRGLRGS